MILAISRAIGETMVVALAAGATAGSLFTLNPLGPGQTLTGAMASLAAGSDQVTGNTAAFQSLFFVGLLLFVMTLGLNVLGDASCAGRGRSIRRADDGSIDRRSAPPTAPSDATASTSRGLSSPARCCSRCSSRWRSSPSWSATQMSQGASGLRRSAGSTS